MVEGPSFYYLKPQSKNQDKLTTQNEPLPFSLNLHKNSKSSDIVLIKKRVSVGSALSPGQVKADQHSLFGKKKPASSTRKVLGKGRNQMV